MSDLRCGQCQRPAVYSSETIVLCVDCYYKFEVSRTLAFRLNAINLNLVADQIDSVTGMGYLSPTPRIQVPDIPRGPTILNNIKIDNSVVGVVNTGSIASIDLSLTYLENAGNHKIKEALQALVEVAANEPSIPEDQRKELLEQLAFLGEQTVASTKDRKPGVLKATFQAITLAAKTFTVLIDAWNDAKPLLSTYFGF